MYRNFNRVLLGDIDAPIICAKGVQIVSQFVQRVCKRENDEDAKRMHISHMRASPVMH